ncbi:DUF4288 domain-containing protein [Streptomyces pharetrae]|uniref:DUF4288 domain-containing protein n=1 Tax=Streptomyces pharetrae TaxID=291370 RepID=UPI00345F32B6
MVMEAVTDEAGPAEGPLHQENFVLVHAHDERSARERVERRARDAETSYLNDREQTVGWRLKAVVDVREAEDTDLAKDADLYTRHFRDRAAYERVEPLPYRGDDPAQAPRTSHGAVPGRVPGGGPTGRREAHDERADSVPGRG